VSAAPGTSCVPAQRAPAARAVAGGPAAMTASSSTPCQPWRSLMSTWGRASTAASSLAGARWRWRIQDTLDCRQLEHGMLLKHCLAAWSFFNVGALIAPQSPHVLQSCCDELSVCGADSGSGLASRLAGSTGSWLPSRLWMCPSRATCCQRCRRRWRSTVGPHCSLVWQPLQSPCSCLDDGPTHGHK
jgi:hypothetical protein